MGVRESERDSAIGVTLAFGLGLGVLLLTQLPGDFARRASNILFGQIFGVSNRQLYLLLAVAALSVLFALVASDGGLLLSLHYNQKASVFVTSISFAIYLVARLVGTRLGVNRRRPVAVQA
jgi:zinc/manganese transport system permease protein